MTLDLNEDHIISDEYLDFFIDIVNDYIEKSNISVTPLDFYFSNKELLYASDLELLKAKMKEIFPEIKWRYILESERPLQHEFIQEIVDNMFRFCEMGDYCVKYNEENKRMLWLDFVKNQNNLINANIYFDSFLNLARWYKYDNGPKTSIKPQYETTLENLTPGKSLYVQGKAETTLVVDLLFMIDRSGSMEDDISRVKNSIVKIGNYLTGRGFDINFAFCKYVDGYFTNEIDFTNDFSYLERNISTFTWGGKEPSLDAMMHGAKNFSWRENVNKIILLGTDEPSNANTYTLDATAKYLNDNDFGVIYSETITRDIQDWRVMMRRRYGYITYTKDDIVPTLNNSIGTSLLRENTWEDIVTWITRLIETKIYYCDVIVPDLSCLDGIPILNTSNCALTFSTLYSMIANSEDIPTNEEQCNVNSDEPEE